MFSKFIKSIAKEVKFFLLFLKVYSKYLLRTLRISFFHFEYFKKIFVIVLYRQRGKNAKRFVHAGLIALVFVGVLIAPVIANEFPGTSVDPSEIPSSSTVLSPYTGDPETETLVSEKVRDKVLDYTVSQGDTVSTIARKFDISTDTVLWQNNLGARDNIKPGSKLQILPVTGISHKVQKGDTVYSIAKKYDTSPQGIVDFPYNTFVNDETFELAIGQIIIVPEGVKPKTQQTSPRIQRLTPNAGTVVASGQFVWPTNGSITQNFYWYHPGTDIANRSLPGIVAADAGTVVSSGWDGTGYGYMIIIDHGNGYKTRYAHMSQLYVVSGQTVSRGAAIGRMGSTGRSTGPHLHFEIYKNGTRLNPLTLLR